MSCAGRHEGGMEHRGQEGVRELGEDDGNKRGGGGKVSVEIEEERVAGALWLSCRKC